MLIVKIEDNERRLSDNQLTKLFQLFFEAQASEGMKGANIDLPLTRLLIQNMKGDIVARSRVGERTVFNDLSPFV